MDLGEVDFGEGVGTRSLRFRPEDSPQAFERTERRRRREAQRPAFDLLARLEPELYPSYIEGEDYVQELSRYRQQKGQERVARAGDEPERSRQRRTELKDRAKNEAFLMLQEGKTPEEAYAELNRRGSPYAGVLLLTDVKLIRRQLSEVNKADPRTQERRSILKQQLGEPPRGVPIELQQDVLDLLAGVDGDAKSATDVVAYLDSIDSPYAEAVRRWLRPQIPREP